MLNKPVVVFYSNGTKWMDASKPAPQEIENWRNDGSMFLFWEFLRNAALLLLSGLCFGTAVYMMVDMLARELPKLMEVMK